MLDKAGLKEWMPTVIGNPWLFRGNLKPIHELIEDKTKQTEMKLAVQVHLDKAYLTVTEECWGKLLNLVTWGKTGNPCYFAQD